MSPVKLMKKVEPIGNKKLISLDDFGGTEVNLVASGKNRGPHIGKMGQF